MHDSTYYGPTTEDYEDHRKAREAFRRVEALEAEVQSLKERVVWLENELGRVLSGG